MSLKDRSSHVLLLLLLLCGLVVIGSLVLHQLLLLSYLILTYAVIGSLLGGISYIYTGLKELRETRRNGEKIPWHQNRNLIQGLALALPLLMDVVTHLLVRSELHPGDNNWPTLDLVLTSLASVLLVVLLFLEITLTIGAIRYLLNRANSHRHALQSLPIEEHLSEE